MPWRWKLGVPVRPPIVIATGSPSDIENLGAGDIGERFSTRRHYYRGVVWLLIALGVQAVASMMPDEVEFLYSQTLFYYIARGLSSVSKFLPSFAIGEILFTLLIFWFLSWLSWYLRRAFRRETRFWDVTRLFFLQILWLMSVLFPIFLLLWGLNYQRLPLAETLEFDRRPARVGELESMGLQIITGLNNNYQLSKGSTESPAASTLPITRDAVFKSIELAFQQESLLGVASQGELSNPKPLYLSRLTSWMGVSGFYIAFTGEVTFNEQIPACDLPMVIAHHKAHQRGYAREDEANFIAYLICINSTEPYVRYSGYLYGLKVLDALARASPDQYDALITRIGEGPQADLRDRAEFWGRMKSSFLGTVARRTFSGYLRANRVPGGIKNFDEDVALIIGYYLKYPERQMPNADPESPSPEPSPTPRMEMEHQQNPF